MPTQKAKTQQKQLEKKYAEEYEYAVMDEHRKRPNIEVKHWNEICPEDWLQEAGYIHDKNAHRLKRLNAKKERKQINPLRDIGFDGMYRETTDINNPVYGGIQAKYYLSKQVSYNDLGSFFDKQFLCRLKNPKSKGMLYSSAKVTKDFGESLQVPNYPIEYIHFPWNPIDINETEKTNRIESPIRNECDLPFYEYQQELMEGLREITGFAGLKIPCGMGKTKIAGHHLQERKPACIMAVAPLKASVQNLKTRFVSFLPEYQQLLVDSDESGTTRKEDVEEFLEKEGHKIIFTTYDSLLNVIAEVENLPENAFILYDEIHGEINNQDLWEFTERFTKGLLMSATLPEEIKDIVDIEILTITFADAIEIGAIVDYTLWLPYITKKSDGTTYVESDIPLEFAHFEKDVCAKAFYLAACMLKTGSRRCIVYLTSKQECKYFLTIIEKVLEEYHGSKYWGNIIDCDVSTEKRRDIIKEFEGGEDDKKMFHILASVRILDEAIDIPRCDSVFVTKVGEKSSDIRMMQRTMRSARKDPKNKAKRNNIFLWAEGWEQCLGSLELLKESDPEFHVKVRIADQNYDGGGGKERIADILLEEKDLKKWTKEQVKCLNLMDTHLLRIDECKMFYNKYREAPKMNGVRDSEDLLSRWMSRIRRSHKLNKLSKDLFNKIVESLPWFYWDKYLEGYEKSLNVLVEFYNKWGEPKGCGDRGNGNEKKLNWWIATVRKSKRVSKLPDGFEEKINKRCPWFRWENKVDEKRYETLDNITKFYLDFSEPPKFDGTRHEGKERSYAIWLARKRTDKKNGKINIELENKMNEQIPWFQWDPINETHIHKINQIKQLYDENGREPPKHSSHSELSTWMTSVRQKKTKGVLSPELELMINTKLPWFRWDPINEQRDEMLQKLVEYYNIYGEPKSVGEKDNGNEGILGAWIIARRQNKKNGSLPLEFEAKINKFCPWFTWETKEERLISKYKCMIAEIKEFFHTYGKPKAKGERPKESIYGEWIQTVKEAKKNNKLDSEIENLINSELPWFIWGNTNTKNTNKTVKELQLFYERHGEPKHKGEKENGLEHKLAVWITNRRVEKRKGKLDIDLENLIKQSFPWFIWEPYDDKFLTTLNELQTFYAEFGEPKFDGDRKFGKEKELASWMSKRRQDKKKGTMLKENENKILETCPWFCWDQFEDKFRNKLNKLKEFYVITGKEPTNSGDPEEKSLCGFIIKLRIDKRNNKLSESEQSEIMELFPWFRWDAIDEKHNRNIQKLNNFYNKYGKPKSNGDRENGAEKDLYRWMCTRREAKKNGQLTKDLEKLINSELPWFSWEGFM